MAESDLMFSSVYDADAADNKTIRDTAFQAASVGRGMVGAHANALGGGLFAQSLGRMAGMKTPAQAKAETITKILEGSSHLDRNNPEHIRRIAEQLVQKGLPGEAEKFFTKARTIETENRTYKLNERTTIVAEGQLTLNQKAQKDANILAWEANGNTQQQINNQMYMHNSRLSFDISTQAYNEKQDAILNGIKNEGMSLEQARLNLAKNAEMFNQAQGTISNERLQAAQDIDEWYKKAQIEIAWAGVNMNKDQFLRSKYEFDVNQTFKVSTQEYQKTQNSILNDLRTGEFNLATADQALKANAEAFKQTQTGIENEQWEKAEARANFLAQAQVAQGWAAHNLNDKKFDHMKYVDDKNLTLSERAQQLGEDKQKFLESNQEILNKISEGSLEIDKGRLLLQQNSFEFDQSRKLITDKQWLDEHNLEKDLAEANIAYTEAQTEGKIQENKAFPKSNALNNTLMEAEAFMKTVKVTNDGVMIFETDKDGNFTGNSHWATDADGDILSDYNVGKQFGLSPDHKRIIDQVWKEYQAMYYTGGSMTEDARWGVPEHLQYNAETNPHGLHQRPTFKEFTERTVERGGHGGHYDVVQVVSQAYGEEGSYQAHLEKEAKLNRKPNEIILQDIDGISFAAPFSIEDLSKDLNIPVNILNKTAVYKEAKNLDNDSNAQILQEIKTLRDAYQATPEHPQYIAYNDMLNDFVAGLNNIDVPTAAATTVNTGANLTAGGPATNEVTAGVDVVNPNEKTVETQVDISPTRTKAAIAATGISAEEGSWKVKTGVWRQNMETMAKYKTVDGVHYVWSRDGAEPEKEREQNIIDQGLDALVDLYRY